jgi:hypothetical protein
MAKVKSVGKSLQKGAKNNTPNSNKRGSERALTLSKTLVKISTSIVFTFNHLKPMSWITTLVHLIGGT